MVCKFSPYHPHPWAHTPQELRRWCFGAMGWYLSHDKNITFALWNFCIYLHQEKRLRALEARKLKQVLAFELL